MVGLAGHRTDGQVAQRHIQMEMLRMCVCVWFFFGYASLGVSRKVKVRDINLGALQLTDHN